MLEILYRPTNEWGFFFPKNEYYIAITLTLLFGISIGFWLCDIKNKRRIKKEKDNE